MRQNMLYYKQKTVGVDPIGIRLDPDDTDFAHSK